MDCPVVAETAQEPGIRIAALATRGILGATEAEVADMAWR